jgi:hypothetical protein
LGNCKISLGKNVGLGVSLGFMGNLIGFGKVLCFILKDGVIFLAVHSGIL